MCAARKNTSRLTGRLGQIKKKNEELGLNLQKFCLTPTQELFKEICANDSVRRAADPEFDVWRLAALYRWSADWEMDIDPETNENIVISHVKFLALEDSLCKAIITSPTKTIATKILHIFFAIGQLKYIDLYYQCMGMEGLPLITRRDLVSYYTNVKDLYIDSIADLLGKDPTHFDKIHLDKSHVDFTYFEKYRKELQHHRENRDEKRKMARGLNQETPLVPAPPTYGINPTTQLE